MATLLAYSQLSHLWKIAAATVLTLMSLGGIVPLVQHKNAAGVVVHKELSDGSSTQSGSLLVGSGSRKVTISNTGNITMQGTMSGDTLHIEKVISNSGGIVTETTVSGSTLQGFGLGSCSDGTNSKVLYNSVNHTFSCGTDQNTGTIYTAGQGLQLNTTSFRLLSAFSGSVIQASSTLASSGTLVFEGAASGSSLYLGTSLDGAGLSSCSNGVTSKLLWNSATKRFSCGADTDTNTTYTAGQGLALNGTVLSTNATQTGTMLRFLTVSGSVITAKTSLVSSGSLKVLSSMSGNTLFVSKNITSSGNTILEGSLTGATLNGFGLPAGGCSNGVTSKLLWNAATSKLSCGTDTDTNTTYTAGQGLTLTTTAFSTNASLTGTSLRFLTISGSVLTAKTSLVSSGALKVLGNMSGNTLFVSKGITSSGNTILEGSLTGASLNGFGLPSGGCSNGVTSKLLWNASTGKLSCGTDTDTNTTYTAAQGLGLNGTAFSLLSTFSGSVIKATTTLASSGGLVWEGAASGSSLYVATSINGAGLTDCSNTTTSKLLWNSTAGRFSCATDQTGGGPGTTYTAGQGLSLSAGNAFFLNATNTGSLSSYQTQSGAAIYAKNTLTSSGTLKVLGNMSGASLNVNNLLSCANLKTNAAGALSCNTSSYQTTSLTDDNVWVGSAGGTATATAVPNCGAGTFLQYATASNAFTCVASTTYTAGQGLTLTATAFSTNATLTGTMIRFLTLSGSNIVAKTSLTSSGVLKVLGNMSGKSLTVMNNASYLLGSTGIGSANAPHTKLEVFGSMSGTSLTVSLGITGSGALEMKGNIATKGTLSGAALAVMNGASYVLGNLGVGSSATAHTKLDVFGSMSGSSLTIDTPLSQLYGGTGLRDFPYKDLILSAAGGTPQTTSGSEALNTSYGTNGINLQSQAYSGTGHTRYAQWTVTMPNSYNGGTMTGSFMWTSTTNPGTTANKVQWGIQCIAYGSGTTIDTAWGTAQTVTASVGASTANQTQTSAATAAITCAGTPAGGKPIQIRVFRDPTVANNLQGTGRLLQTLLRFKTNNYSD